VQGTRQNKTEEGAAGILEEVPKVEKQKAGIMARGALAGWILVCSDW
jgi:hypothetical protein